ncbi:MAG: acyltransferase [Bacteroidales bacterium]|nr:acyltransferase [Bacteroidales bacterium]
MRQKVNSDASNVVRRDNCFTLLRYLFFFCILCNHFFVINGAEETPFIGIYLVQGFFIISGVLVYNSYERSGSAKVFALKRFLRIYPAYFTVVLSGFIVMAFATKLPWNEYFTHRETWKYLFANLCFGNFLQPTLPGVFEDNPLPWINSSLWTLKVEIMFYFTVPIVAWLVKKFGYKVVLIPIVAFSFLWDISTMQLYVLTEKKIFYDLNHQIFGELAYFYFPVLIYHYRDKILKSWLVLLAAAALLVLISYVYQLRPLSCFALPLAVMFVAYRFTFLFKWSVVTDYSYEMYLVRFPTLQMLCLSSLPFTFGTFALGFVLISMMAVPLHHVCDHFSYKKMYKRGALDRILKTCG